LKLPGKYATRWWYLYCHTVEGTSVIKKWGKDNYFLIGPYFEEQAAAHFDPATDFSSPIGNAVLKMQERGFDVHYGQWIVSGRPNVILFNPYSVYDKLGEIKHHVWNDYQISLL
jgi:glycogen(starch) synthase